MNVTPIARAVRTTRARVWSRLLLAAACAGLAGCHQQDSLPNLQVYEVKGKVVLADGSPLSEGWIYLVPKGDLTVTPSAQLSSDGTFAVTTGGSGAGAPAGDYKVRVESPRLQSNPKSRKALFPTKYTDEDSSGLVVTVKPQTNQLDPITLK